MWVTNGRESKIHTTEVRSDNYGKLVSEMKLSLGKLRGSN